MKRLRSKLSYSIKQAFRRKRNRRMIVAEWISNEPSDPNLVQNITDIMATGGQIQIQYNGEYKTILPYGWNSSKDGNVLLMCYKDTGEVRSYRLDRITEVLFDSDNLPINMQMESGENLNEQDPNEETGDIPQLPDEELSNDEFTENQDLPFDDALEVMEDEDNIDNENIDNENINNENQNDEQNEDQFNDNFDNEMFNPNNNDEQNNQDQLM